MSRTLKSAMMIWTVATCLGCSTPRLAVNLFDRQDFILTKPPDVVAGVTTTERGVWLSNEAIGILQNRGALAGAIKESK